MFDRFAVATAYYWYYVLWHAGGLTARCRAQGRGIGQQLHRMRYRPGPLATPEGMTWQERDIYYALVERWEGADELRLAYLPGDAEEVS